LKKLLEKAGKTIVETCSQLKPKEVVSIITDKDSIDIGMLIKRHASEISTNIHVHILEDEYLIGRLIMLATKNGREIHMPSIDETILKTGMQANYYKIASLTFMIMGIAVKSKTARVITP